MSSRSVAIGVDIGGTKIAAATVDRQGNIVSAHTISTPLQSSEVAVDAITQLIETIKTASSGIVEPVGIGIAVAGTVDWAHGTIVQSPNLPFSDIKLRAIIEKSCGLPTVLDNDANLATFGEKHYGTARDANHIVGLTLGTGIGSGIICDGRLYRGATGSAAELGHMVITAEGPRCTCGSYGCFEEMASGRALVRLAKERVVLDGGGLIGEMAGGDPALVTGPMVTEAAHQGDVAANEVFAEVGFWLGIGINNIINIFNPEIVVIDGGMAEAGELVLAPARAVVAERALHPNKDVAKIVRGQLGNQAGMLGAAALVFETFDAG
ncbi:MAG: ROK family protein [Candidatus Aquicultor sp.]|nr:ROK family protein [Candidatus Aquicultor sp.]